MIIALHPERIGRDQSRDIVDRKFIGQGRDLVVVGNLVQITGNLCALGLDHEGGEDTVGDPDLGGIGRGLELVGHAQENEDRGQDVVVVGRAPDHEVYIEDDGDEEEDQELDQGHGYTEGEVGKDDGTVHIRDLTDIQNTIHHGERHRVKLVQQTL